MSKRFKAAIIGGSGYGAGEMLRRLLVHPDVEVIRVASVDLVGKNVAAAHPNLYGLTDLVLEDVPPRVAARGCDVALLALPHKVTAEKVPELLELGVKVVDMSGDFRLRSAAEYAAFYGAAHPHPELLGTFVYGLPELNRGAIKKSSRVSSPGCFATATELALLPLARAGLLRGPIHVSAITGSSGSGAAPQAGTHHPVRAVNLKTYKPLVHQHTPEIVQTLRDAGADEVELRFVPVSAPLSRGIFLTAFVEVDAAWDERRIAGLFDERYHAEPFVRRPLERLPEVAAVSGSNYVEVGFAVDEARAGRRTVTCFAAIVATVLDVLHRRYRDERNFQASEIASYAGEAETGAISFKAALELASGKSLPIISSPTISARLRAIKDRPTQIGAKLLVLRYSSDHHGGTFKVSELKGDNH